MQIRKESGFKMKKWIVIVGSLILGLGSWCWLGNNHQVAAASQWYLKVVNVNHHLSATDTPKLTTVDNNQQLDARVVKSYYKMTAAAKKAGATLVAGSGYRSYEHQKEVLARNIQERENQGMSYKQAKKNALKTVNAPGSSEHQTGLAMDFLTPGEAQSNSDVTQKFAKTAQGKWLAKNSWKYGWILRYPKHEKHATHIDYESWHFRYVGKKAASYIYHHHITLEQYVASKR